MYKRSGKKIAPLITGGGQERNLRSSTENLPAIAAMARAVRLLLDDQDKKVAKQLEIKQNILSHISQFDKVKIFSKDNDGFAPHILCFAILGVRGETVVHAFESFGIYISTTSACSSKRHVASGTLSAMKVDEDESTSAVRISLDEHNSLEEANKFNEVFDELYERFKKINS
ncbi:hypothetical protein AP20H10_06320 [Apilactobacillus apinorum]|uniref:Aminotransferase class V domain-containing protein n=4 Tax=Apilactobacillus apinorum TaxID=1218495 RepID=A0ABP9ZHL7_9LACO